MADISTITSALRRKVLANDEEVTSLSFEGGSHTTKRGVTNSELLEAVDALLSALADEDDAGSSGGMILPMFANIPR